jgi:hypothetical protein
MRDWSIHPQRARLQQENILNDWANIYCKQAQVLAVTLAVVYMKYNRTHIWLKIYAPLIYEHIFTRFMKPESMFSSAERHK